MFLRNTNKKKKGNLIAQFVVLLVVAAILILVITSFGAKIWSAFFPNSDKSTLKSFDMLYQVINAKTVSELDYDYTPINIYMKENYRIVFFEKDKLSCGQVTAISIGGSVTGSTSTSTTSEVIYNRPTSCDNTQCICLYKNTPSQSLKDKDKYVVKCNKLVKDVNLVPLNSPNALLDPSKLFELNKKACGAVTGTKFTSTNTNTEYSSYLIIKYNEYDDTGTAVPRVYILEDTEANQKLNSELNTVKCAKDNTNNALLTLCNGKADGQIIETNEPKTLDTIYTECNKQNKKSTSITCKFTQDVTNRICTAICNDESKICDAKDECNSYNQISGVYNLNYITPNTNNNNQIYEYKYTYMCENNANYCGNGLTTPSTCQVTPLTIYSYIDDTTDGGYTHKQEPNKEDLYLTITKCITDTDRINRNNKWFIKSYKTYNVECAHLFNKYFPDNRQVYSCNPNNIKKCKEIIEDKIISSKCEFKYIQDSGKYWITYFKDDATCQELADTSIFLPVNLCTKI